VHGVPTTAGDVAVAVVGTAGDAPPELVTPGAEVAVTLALPVIAGGTAATAGLLLRLCLRPPTAALPDAPAPASPAELTAVDVPAAPPPPPPPPPPRDCCESRARASVIRAASSPLSPLPLPGTLPPAPPLLLPPVALRVSSKKGISESSTPSSRRPLRALARTAADMIPAGNDSGKWGPPVPAPPPAILSTLSPPPLPPLLDDITSSSLVRARCVPQTAAIREAARPVNPVAPRAAFVLPATPVVWPVARSPTRRSVLDAGLVPDAGAAADAGGRFVSRLSKEVARSRVDVTAGAAGEAVGPTLPPTPGVTAVLIAGDDPAAGDPDTDAAVIPAGEAAGARAGVPVDGVGAAAGPPAGDTGGVTADATDGDGDAEGSTTAAELAATRRARGVGGGGSGTTADGGR